MNLRRSEFKRLITEREGPHVSIYLPTHRRGPQTRQDPIRLKNLIRDAETRLLDLGKSARDADRILSDGRRLLDDTAFWNHRTNGLCLFLATDFHRRYDLPFRCDELLVVTRRFHLKPVVPLLYRDARFYLLALSQKDVRFFVCDRDRIVQTEVAAMPRSLEDATVHEDPERQIQFHTGTPATAGGSRPAIYHGHGAGADDAETRLLRYFQVIDRALGPVLAADDAPLVLAGVDYLHAIYRKANSYRGLIGEGISGNPQGREEGELHRRAWKVVSPCFEGRRGEALAEYEALSGSGDARRADDLERVLPAALHGRVAYLFVAVGVQQWGSYAAAADRLEIRDEAMPGDEDLLDLAAIHTLAHGGEVYALPPEEMPTEGTVAAVYRY